MSGSLPVSKLRFNLKHCACAVNIRASTFASLAASSIYNNFACTATMLFCDGLIFFFFSNMASEVSSNVEHETTLYSHHRPCN